MRKYWDFLKRRLRKLIIFKRDKISDDEIIKFIEKAVEETHNI